MVRPKSPRSWEPMMITLVAEVNPLTTGADMKSTKKPRSSKPIVSSTIPARRARRIKNSGGRPRVYDEANMAIRDVGPIDTYT